MKLIGKFLGAMHNGVTRNGNSKFVLAFQEVDERGVCFIHTRPNCSLGSNAGNLVRQSLKGSTFEVDVQPTGAKAYLNDAKVREDY